MGTVKYTWPVASFHCPTNATIRSLKVHFSPKQLGEGDPSPENVREIVGWDGVKIEQSSKNLFDANNPNIIVPNCWVSSNGDKKITPSNADRSLYISCLPNTTYTISKTIGNVLAAGYTTDLPALGMATYSYYRDSANARQVTITTGSDAKYIAIWFYDSSKTFDRTVDPETIYRTLQVEYGSTATPYGSYQGSTTNYDFGVLGKNKFPASDGTKSSIFLAANTAYTFSATSPSSGYFKGWYEDETDTGLIWINAGSDGNRRWRTYTPERDIVSGLFYVGTGMSECQIELGSTATAYEPYDPNHTVYGGWVDLVSGEVCEEWKSIALESLGWSGSGNRARASNSIDLEIPSYTIAPNFIAEKYYAASYSTQLTSHPSGIALGNAGFIAYYDGETLPSGKMVYKLSEPIIYNLHPHSSELKTFLGQNNVWSNADYVEVEYDLHETEDILRRKQFIIANQPHIESASGNPANFQTDMVAKLKSCKVYFEPKQEGSGDPSPDNIRLISGWDTVKIGLPDEYQAIEYLENKDTAFIMTDYPSSIVSRVDIDFNYVQERTWANLLGASNSTSDPRGNGILLTHSGNLKLSVYDHPGAIVTQPLEINKRYRLSGIFKSGDQKLIINDTVMGTSNYIYTQSVSNMSIFGLYYGTQTNKPSERALVKVYSCQFYTGENEQLLANFIPCIRKSDNKPGLYEVIHGVFYTNAGLNEFAIGPICQIDAAEINWSSTAGTIYGGYIDLITGEVWETFHKLTIDGTTTGCKVNSDYSDETYIVGGVVYLSPAGLGDYQSGVSKLYCDAMPLLTPGQVLTTLPCVRTIRAGNQYLRIYFAYTEDHPELTTKQLRIDFANNYLQDHPFNIVYPLKTPQLIATLTPTQLKTLRGTNNIWSNANGPIEVQYWTH